MHAALLREIETGYAHVVLTWVGGDGYPVSVATGYIVEGETIRLRAPAMDVPEGVEANVTFSHIRPQRGVGYDERRYVVGRGSVARDGDDLLITPISAYAWNEERTPFFEYSERSVPRARRYFARLRTRPRLAAGWLALRATRLPFLTATIVPVALGVAVAARHGHVRWGLAGLTLLGACLIHLGLNVSNDVFDALSGADDANTTPTPFSGGSRVIQYGLVSLKTMAALSAIFYAGGIGIGFLLAVWRGFWPLVGLGAIGVAISIAYTAPPLRLVHRGLGEIAVALGFGPVVVLGAYFVQAQRYSLEALYASLPVALLIALVLYANEIPDRRGDEKAGKRTLPVRLSKDAVLRVYTVLAAATYVLLAAGVAATVLPIPALAALATLPWAVSVRRGLGSHYDDPYALMPVMAKGISLHLVTGLLLVAGYAATAVFGL